MKIISRQVCIFFLLALASFAVQAADWSNTWVGYRWGTQFREPAITSDISKNILQIQHSGSYRYGVNFFNVDMLESGSNDPALNGGGGAQETVVVYRNTVSLSKLSGEKYGAGFIRDIGVQFGMDWNSRNDVIASRLYRPMAGPNISLDVPGYWNVGLLWQHERNHNGVTGKDVAYDNTWRLATAWDIPLGVASVPGKFRGFANYISAKGTNGFGKQTKPETLLEAFLMLDAGSAMASEKGIVFIGIGYQYWKNKYGNDSSADASGGSFSRTPQFQLEWRL